MGWKVALEELRLAVVPQGVTIEWWRAAHHPAPLVAEQEWTRVESARWSPGNELPSVLERFVASARRAYGTRGAFHRISLRLDDRLEPSFEELDRRHPGFLRGDVWRGDPLLLWRASQSARSRGREPASRLPIGVDLRDVPRDALTSESFIEAAIRRGLLDVRTWEDTSRTDEPLEGDILHVVDGYYRFTPDNVRRLLRRRKRLPRLVLIERRWPWFWMAPAMAEAVLSEGCQAVVILSKQRVEPPSQTARALYRKLLHDLPLDVALVEALQANEEEGVHAFLAVAENAELEPLLSRALLEHQHGEGPPQRLSYVLDQAERGSRPAARRGELGQFIAHRIQRVHEQSRDIASHLDALTFSEEAASLEGFVHLHERSAQTVAEWSSILRVESLLATGGRRGTPPQPPPYFESLPLSTPDFEEDRLEIPPRWTDVWLTTAFGEQRVPDETPLVPGDRYELHVQIGFVRAGLMAIGELPLQQLAEAFADADAIPLDILIFARDVDFDLKVKSTTLMLPRFGESDVAVFPLWPLVLEGATTPAPRRRVRLCIYHRNHLLQSVAIDLSVVAGHPTTIALDYMASDELLVVDELPPAAVSFFVNEGPDGSHWLGIAGLQKPAVLDLHPLQLKERIGELRKRYDAAQGFKTHLYEGELTPGSPNWDDRVAELIGLAELGRDIHFDFITAHGALDEAQKQSLTKLLRGTDKLIHVARCHESAPGLPWGAFYDYDLERSEDKTSLHLCGVFESQLATSVETKKAQDLLDAPEVCRARLDCPLNQEGASTTVCPFGFWGIRHRIEQPTHAVKPGAFAAGDGVVLPRVIRSSPLVEAEPSLIVSHWKFDNTEAHEQELRKLATQYGGGIEVATTESRLKELLQNTRVGTTPAGIVYFYCHGDEVKNAFALKLGDEDAPFKLDAYRLSQWKAKWATPNNAPQWPHGPLVVLNGCETLAVSPERVHGFLVVLRDLGAGGVVGPEVPIWSDMAQHVGESLVRKFFSGTALGEALRSVQRDLMRKLNPLGLMYVAYARSDLHLVRQQETPGSSPPTSGGPVS